MVLGLAAWLQAWRRAANSEPARFRAQWLEYWAANGPIPRGHCGECSMGMHTPPLFHDRDGARLEGWIMWIRGPGGRAPVPALRREGTPPSCGYESHLPGDGWGKPWILAAPESGAGRVYSSGPDGRFEWGEGDDIDVDYPPDPPDPRLLGAGLLVGLTWVSFRLGLRPRSASMATEVVIATLMTLAPAGILTWVVLSGGLSFVPVDDRLLLVDSRTALLGSGIALTWGLALGVRLSGRGAPRRPSRTPSSGSA